MNPIQGLAALLAAVITVGLPIAILLSVTRHEEKHLAQNLDEHQKSL